MSWETVALGEVANIGAGNSAPQEKNLFKNGTHNFYRTSDVGRIRNGVIYHALDKLNSDGIKGLKLHTAGTILFPKSGASTFLNHRVMLGKEGFVSSHLATIKARNGIAYDKFLLYFLSTIDAKNLVQDSNYPSLKTSVIEKISIPFPSLATQQKIVQKLDSIFAEIDRATVATEANVKNAEALFQSYLTQVFERLFFGNKSLPLKNISKFENGDRGKNYPSKHHQVESGIPFINAGDLKDDWKISREGMAFITEERFNLLGAGKIKIGDLLFCLRGSLGKCGIVEDIDVGAIASSLVIIRPTKNMAFNKYIYWFLSSSICARYIRETSGGTAQPNLSAKSVMNYLVPLVSYDEQCDISSQIDDFYLNVENVKSSFLNKVAELNYLKQSILKQAFNGELIKE